MDNAKFACYCGSSIRKRGRSLDPAVLSVFSRAKAGFFVNPDQAIARDRDQTSEFRMSPRHFVQAGINLKTQTNLIIVKNKTKSILRLFKSFTLSSSL